MEDSSDIINPVINLDSRTLCKYDLNEEKTTDKNMTLRSSNSFDFKTKCLFCNTEAKLVQKKRGFDVFPVRTLDFQKSIVTKCKERNDDWALCVLGRIENVFDLPAADAVYHQSCNVNFRTGRQLPKCFLTKQNKMSGGTIKSPGRPVDEIQIDAFNDIVTFVENSKGNVVTIRDLVSRMTSICGCKAYGPKHMKSKLITHFGSNIVIGELDGKNDTVTLKVTASSIIHDFHKNVQMKCQQDENISVITEAAKCIRNDIQSIDSCKIFYPSPQTVSSLEENLSLLPNSLYTFLRHIFSEKDSDVKIAAIGQAIIQSCRPRNVISPLQLGLGVQMHHQFGSRFLIDTLNSLGFCASYREVQKFELNAAAANNTCILDYFPGKFVQFVADNADHNTRTLDGHNTFHGMGIIACTTPGSKVHVVTPRTDVITSELAEIGRVDIKYYKVPEEQTEMRFFTKLGDIKADILYNRVNLFAKSIWTVRQSKPAWSGFMQLFQDGRYPGISNVTFLPMIDLNPSDMTCIYSTLWFVCKQSAKYGVTPVITFDQPLFMKANTIINEQVHGSPLREIVLRLGGFHTEMSFLGSIGQLMSETGLQEVLETVYAPNAVVHMMSGKSVHRAIRGHFLMDTALHALLISQIYGIPTSTASLVSLSGYNSMKTDALASTALTSESDTSVALHHQSDEQEMEDESYMDDRDKTATYTFGDEIEIIGEMYDKLTKGEITLEEAANDENLLRVEDRISHQKLKLRSNRTASIWFQYMDMVSILQRFLIAERTGDWEQHLSALKSMLPYFASSGHTLYLKSAYIYLQNMLNLEKEHPDVYKAFQDGRHVVRRSDRFWAGLSTDLVIEQVLMRSLKTTGGLTRGRGLTDTQRAQWILSMPACTDMNNSMQEITNVEYQTSEQHKEAGKSRSIRDTNDTKTLYSFLSERNPFDDDEMCLRNIETGVIAEPSVNADKALAVGTKILDDMIGKSVGNYSFRKSQQVIRMHAKSAIKVNDELIQVDPQLLFQRLIAAANRHIPDMPEIFQYELCSVPPALFDKTGLPRPAQKANLADLIWSLGDCSEHQIPSRVKYVLDGGSFLQRIPWQKNSTFSEICDQYLRCIQQRYENASVVFDGYATSSIKDITHIRRGKGSIGSKVIFRLETPFRSKKETFLNNKENKQAFIHMLGDFLSEKGIQVLQANGDADTMIVDTAVSQSLIHDTVVIGEDTDLLVLLCCHAGIDSHTIFFKSDIRRIRHVPKLWNIQKTKLILGPELCQSLPFLHALTGCDTTSQIYGISKPAGLRLYMKEPSFRDLAETFIKSSTHDDVVKCGESAMILLHNGVPQEGLNLLRFRKFSQKVLKSNSCIQVQSLPPTSAAVRYHSLRVYLQTQIWLGKNTLNPQDWGWEISDSQFYPVKTDLPPAPEKLLKVIRCSCRQNCDTKRCTCRKHGLECSPGCGACHGTCSNSVYLEEEDICDI